MLLDRAGSRGTAVASLAAACGGGAAAEPAAGTPAAPVTNPVDPATAGSDHRHVTFEGTPPPAEPIKTQSDPTLHEAGRQDRARTCVVGDGSLQNVFVYVKDGLGNLKFPGARDAGGARPEGLPVPAARASASRSARRSTSSTATHAAQRACAADGQPGIQLRAGAAGDARITHVFSTSEVMVPFKCDVHNWMNAYVGVVDHPFFAVTGADGAF